ncbi:Ku protein [Paracidovorax cattleyae]|uniref:Non-homologous end joining protein Ku n=1 Tax=Paracidovorax cattleyae TaxID=80868 RepID=A0A1H0U8I1_9BURK|nr:Ku protein [Paracidovorax cattleyae]AVS74658.1 Ku protein [Paracidovorax cattleyae]SDP62295.1 DNA end-binding protein Ku [Paracidovorax cattleyae]
MAEKKTRTTRSRAASAPATPAQAPTSTRALWKGAISFGLVHVPVGLYSATRDSGIDFDWLDKRSMDPVGYKRINKKTGKEITAENIVKGVEYEDGRYVVLTPEEIAQAYPKTTQTIEIEAFLDADEIPFVYLERPYYTAPLPRGEKVYALLREALKASHRVGMGKVVIQTKQHLAVLIPCGRALVLNLLRWGDEIRSFQELNLPPAGGKAVGLKDAEMRMARQLIDDMTQGWDADQFRNSFSEEIMKLVEARAQAGDIAEVEPLEAPSDAGGADVVDLTALLRRSLEGGRRKAAADADGKKEEEGEDETQDGAKGRKTSSVRHLPDASAKTARTRATSAGGAKGKAKATTKRATARSSAKSAPAGRKAA